MPLKHDTLLKWVFSTLKLELYLTSEKLLLLLLLVAMHRYRFFSTFFLCQHIIIINYYLRYILQVNCTTKYFFYLLAFFNFSKLYEQQCKKIMLRFKVLLGGRVSYPDFRTRLSYVVFLLVISFYIYLDDFRFCDDGIL